ncbi:hypothetical protein GIB67_010434 [Kingdonia uniflora]|uniref:Uncharacterized protein n=1 Tax=Kingdonia uniflora TaxID=39325 RepID=A0A7J7MAR1_9MAGN|nr:hypothetical protein GIB67_010434 [Kingdonia uniflora]
MEISPRNHQSSPPPSFDLKALIYFYANRIWRNLTGFFPLSYNPIFLLTRVSNLYLRTSRARSWRRNPGLPLPLPSTSLESPLVVYMDNVEVKVEIRAGVGS